MDAQDLVTGTRWDLLKLTAEQPRTGAELAHLVNTSAANVSQHLKLLEIGGLVVKERVNGKAVHYKLAQPAALITLLAERPVREIRPLDGLDGLELRLFLEKKPRSRYLRKLLCLHEELVKTFLAFGIVKDAEDLQLLVLAEDVKPLRKEYANILLGDKKIVIWSHTPEEFKDGLARKEHYFVDMFKKLTVIYDPEGLFSKMEAA